MGDQHECWRMLCLGCSQAVVESACACPDRPSFYDVLRGYHDDCYEQLLPRMQQWAPKQGAA